MTLGTVARRFGVSNYIVKTWIEKGILEATVNETEYDINETSVLKVEQMRNDYIGISDFIDTELSHVPTVWDKTRQTDRYQLYEAIKHSAICDLFMSRDELPADNNKSNVFYFHKDNKAIIYEWLRDYLYHFGKTEERLEMLLKDPFWNNHPETNKAFQRFSSNKEAACVVVLAEALIHSLYHEYPDATLEELADILRYIDKFGTDKYLLYFGQFAKYMKNNYDCAERIAVQSPRNKNSKSENNINTNPYSFKQYMEGAYICFNQKYCDEQHLIEKALENPKYATMWLLMIFGYVAAWRTSDIYRIPILPLPYDRETVIEKLLQDSFEQDAIALSLKMEHEINSRHMVPQKTSGVQKRFELVVHFHDTLRAVIGTVYAICLLHTTGDRLDTIRVEPKDYVSFFGPKYYEVFENNTFLNRRSNKAYMDVLVDITERMTDSHNKVLGYAVASYARAHVHDEHELARTTEVYLQTKLDGIGVNEVLMNLFASGSCSFIAEMMLEVIYPERFEKLLLEDRTKIIEEFSLTAYQSELVAKMVNHHYTQSKKLVTSLCCNVGDIATEDLFVKAAHNVAGNTAKAKNPAIDCLCIALGGNCPNKTSQECFGCSFSMPQMGVFYHGLDLIKATKEQYKNATTDGEKKKYGLMLNDIYLPAMFGLLSAMKAKGVDITKYKNDVQAIFSEVK